MLQRLTRTFLASLKSARWRGAFAVALVSDAVGFGVVLVPPVQWLVDAVTAALLFAVLGFRWSLLSALAVEVVPGLELFPAWTLVVAALAATETPRKLPGRVDAERHRIT